MHAKKVWESVLEEQNAYRWSAMRSIIRLYWRADIQFSRQAEALYWNNTENEDTAILGQILDLQVQARNQHEQREPPLAPPPVPVAPPAPVVPRAPVPVAPAQPQQPQQPQQQQPQNFEEEFFGALLAQAMAAPLLGPLAHIRAHIHPGAAGAAGAGAAAVPAIPQVFTDDRQNIHRASVVTYVKDMMARLATIPVPPKQKTAGEILVALDLSDKAALKLTDMYYHTDSIYEIPEAYKKALDPIWAYIKGHEERAELELRLQQELEDNIGMCAQGNLSRLINAVSGYLDGVAPPVSVGERLQNGFAAIAGKSMSTLKKIQEGKALLTELKVPKAEWDTWLEAF